MKNRTNSGIATELGRRLGVKVFSPAYEIIALLDEVGDISTKELAYETRLPPASLNRILHILADRKLIETTRGAPDSRRRIIELSESARDTLKNELSFFLDWPNNSASAPEDLSSFVIALQRALRVPLFTYDYKIILSSYKRDHVRTTQLTEISGVPVRSFYNRLLDLRRTGVIGSVRDLDDGRGIGTSLSTWAIESLDEAHDEMTRYFARLQAPPAGDV